MADKVHVRVEELGLAEHTYEVDIPDCYVLNGGGSRFSIADLVRILYQLSQGRGVVVYGYCDAVSQFEMSRWLVSDGVKDAVRDAVRDSLRDTDWKALLEEINSSKPRP